MEILKTLKEKKKGSAVVWLTILILIFVISLFYLLFSQIIYVYIKPTVLAAMDNATVNTTRVQSTLDLIDVMWQYWPLILILGLIFFGFVASQKREPDEYYY